MIEKRTRTSMSVVEMGRLLGLSKTEAYWLVKKNYFKTIQIGNTMRVMIDSFETWYANQFKYKKVDGTLPGDELKKTTYSVDELGHLLGLKEAASYALISKGHFDVVEVLGKRRITKDSFDKWYSSQKEYRTLEDQAREANVVTSTYSVLEIAKMLGTSKQAIFAMMTKGLFDVQIVGRMKRITKESFYRWYESQAKYRSTSITYASERGLE